MAIDIDVLLVASAKQRPDLSVIVDLNGALGSTSVSGSIDVDADLGADATGAWLALSSDITETIGVAGSVKRILMSTPDNTSPYEAFSWQQFYWTMETIDLMEFYEIILRTGTLVTTDVYGDETLPMEVEATSTLTLLHSVPITIPNAPSPPPPPEPSGDFPMPAAGGMIVRAVPGIAVQVDTPVIVDGRPT